MSESIIKILSEILKQQQSELAPSYSADAFFNLFTSEQILKDFELSYEEIESGIIEGSGDGGIDSIYTFLNGELLEEDSDYTNLKKDIVIDLFIIQSKNTIGFGEEAIHKFIASANDLLNLAKDLSGLKTTYKEELLKKIELFRNANLKLASRFPRLNINYFYCSLGDQPHPNVERKVPHLEQTISSFYSDYNFTFAFIGSEKLLKLARKQPIKSKSVVVEETIPTSDGGYISLDNLKSYFDFITDNGKLIKSFFDANVRDYQGKIEVNNAIKDTLNNITEEDFWWLNNGVTITTSRATLTGKSLEILEPQIVNGLQSSYEIFNFFNAGRAEAEKRKILIRVIKPSAEKSRIKIIKATNSQTNVPVASLRSTDEIHLNIEDYFQAHGFYYDRRKNFYKNNGKPIKQIISIPYLAQIITAIILKEPDNSRGRPSSLLKKDDEYIRIFDPSYEPEVFLKSVKLQKDVEAQLKSYTPELSTNLIGDIKFHIAMFTIVKHLKKVNFSTSDFLKADLTKISDADIKSNIDEVKQIYESLGGTNRVAKSSEFVKSINQRLAEIIAEYKAGLKEAAIEVKKEL